VKALAGATFARLVGLAFLSPQAGRGDPAGPAIRRAHRDAAGRNSICRWTGRRQHKTARKLNRNSGQMCPQAAAPPRLRFICIRSETFGRWDCIKALREKRAKEVPVRRLHARSHVPQPPRRPPPKCGGFFAYSLGVHR